MCCPMGTGASDAEEGATLLPPDAAKLPRGPPLLAIRTTSIQSSVGTSSIHSLDYVPSIRLNFAPWAITHRPGGSPKER